MEEKKTERSEEVGDLLNECNAFVANFYGNRKLKREEIEMFLLSELVTRMLFIIGARLGAISVFRLFILFVGRLMMYVANNKRNIQKQYTDVVLSLYGDKGNSESMC